MQKTRSRRSFQADEAILREFTLLLLHRRRCNLSTEGTPLRLRTWRKLGVNLEERESRVIEASGRGPLSDRRWPPVCHTFARNPCMPFAPLPSLQLLPEP
ncbi:hypothetical protein C8R44DRAFT_766774 [Mycena epipterygia]|nr:hypothetical protein C8R44DRAFT_766774 [Mycena epipterygia]